VSEAPRQFLDASSLRYLSFWARGEKGGEEFQISLTDEGSIAKEGRPPRELRTYMRGGLSKSWRQVAIPLSDFRGLDARKLARVTFSVTRPGDGRFYLDDIGFQQAATMKMPTKVSRNPSAPAMSNGTKRAMWAWNTKPLFDPDRPEQAERFFKFCAAQKIEAVYLAAEFDRPVDPASGRLQLRNRDGYGAFLKRAHQQGLSVEALAGTPEWAIRENHPQALAVVDAILDYQNPSDSSARFDGIHFDVEPYSLLGFSDPAYRSEILMGLVEISQQCAGRARAAGLTFSCDVPSWFYPTRGPERNRLTVNIDGQEKAIGEHLTDATDSVTIMDYTNQADGAGGIVARGLPALEYAASRNKKIMVGVETFSESDSPVSFVCGLPDEVFWPRLARSGLRNQLVFEDFRMSIFSDGVNVHIGLSTPRDMTPEKKSAFEGALSRLSAQLGASIDPEKYSAAGTLTVARAAMAGDADWIGFEPFELTDSESGRSFKGFQSTHRMLPGTTFYGLGKEVFHEEIASTVEWLGRHPAFGGIAVHFYDSFRDLIEGPEEEQIKRQMAKGKGQRAKIKSSYFAVPHRMTVTQTKSLENWTGVVCRLR
jgi:hypothetical protein